jgi:hypothetical protein
LAERLKSFEYCTLDADVRMGDKMEYQLREGCDEPAPKPMKSRGHERAFSIASLIEAREK